MYPRGSHSTWWHPIGSTAFKFEEKGSLQRTRGALQLRRPLGVHGFWRGHTMYVKNRTCVCPFVAFLQERDAKEVPENIANHLFVDACLLVVCALWDGCLYFRSQQLWVVGSYEKPFAVFRCSASLGLQGSSKNSRSWGTIPLFLSTMEQAICSRLLP